MKAIVEMNQEEQKEYGKKFDQLREKLAINTRNELLPDLHKMVGYAHYRFSGRIGQALVDALGRQPTPEEIIMLVDNGFWHFGAECHINGDRFTGRVNTD